MMSNMKTAKYLRVKSGQITWNLALILNLQVDSHVHLQSKSSTGIRSFSITIQMKPLWKNFCLVLFTSKDFMKKVWSSWYIFSSTNIRSWRLSCFSTRNTIMISTLGVVEAVVSVVVGVLGWSIVPRYTTFLLIFLQSEKNILLLMTFTTLELVLYTIIHKAVAWK